MLFFIHGLPSVTFLIDCDNNDTNNCDKLESKVSPCHRRLIEPDKQNAFDSQISSGNFYYLLNLIPFIGYFMVL